MPRFGDKHAPRPYNAGTGPLAAVAVLALVVIAWLVYNVAAGNLDPLTGYPRQPGPAPAQTSDSYNPGTSHQTRTKTSGHSPLPHKQDTTSAKTEASRNYASDYQGVPLSPDVAPTEVGPVNCLAKAPHVCGPEWKKPRADVLGALEKHGTCVWQPATKTNKLETTWIICDDGFITNVG
jgi:hypothetical protein